MISHSSIQNILSNDLQLILFSNSKNSLLNKITKINYYNSFYFNFTGIWQFAKYFN